MVENREERRICLCYEEKADDFLANIKQHYQDSRSLVREVIERHKKLI